MRVEKEFDWGDAFRLRTHLHLNKENMRQAGSAGQIWTMHATIPCACLRTLLFLPSQSSKSRALTMSR